MIDTLFHFCVGCLLLIPSFANATDAGCHTTQTDEIVRIRYVHDGDTVWLTDGRKLRIIGINTPELARNGRPSEPLAEHARDALRQLLDKSTPIRLRYGQEKTDRYGRLLAHLYLHNGQNISAWLLRRGLAFAITIPPNLGHIECYQRAEQQARQQRKGLWSKHHNRVLHTDNLPVSTRGYQIIRGRVQRIGQSRKAIWINFQGKFALRIVRQDLTYFKDIDFKKLTGKRIEVRGWVHYHKQQLRMRIRHPASMRILP